MKILERLSTLKTKKSRTTLAYDFVPENLFDFQNYTILTLHTKYDFKKDSLSRSVLK